METAELLTSLAELENSLRGIESAKKQVKQTVDAYSVLQGQIKAYTDSLDSIKRSVAGIVSELRAQRVSLDEEASGAISALEEKAGMLFSRISESSSDVLKQIESHLDTANKLFSKDSKAIAESFKNSTNDELAKLQENVQTLKECAATFNTLDNSIKSTLSKIDGIRTEIAELKKVLSNSQNSQDEILKQIQDSIISLSQKDEQALLELFKNIKSSLSQIEDVRTRIAELKKALSNSQNAQDEILEQIQDNIISLSQRDEQALLELSKSIESSNEMQVKLLDGIKGDIDLISKNQEQSFSSIFGNFESIKKENHQLRILLIANILLAIGHTILTLVK